MTVFDPILIYPNKINYPVLKDNATPLQGYLTGICDNFPTGDVTIKWTLYDKSDQELGGIDWFRSGGYLVYTDFSVSLDSTFSGDENSLFINSRQRSHHFPSGNYRTIFSDMFNAGVGNIQEYSYKIPLNKFVPNTQYYVRIRAIYQLGYVNRFDDTNTLILYDGYKEAIPIRFDIKTTENTPVINEFSCTPIGNFDSFGGEVLIKWSTSKSIKAPVTDAIYTSISPIDLPGLGNNIANVNTSPGVKVFIDKTTTFKLTVSTANGGASAPPQERTVKVDPIEGIDVEFMDSLIHTTDNLNTGDYISNVGDTATLQLYTEYVKDVHIFVAYPINVSMDKINIGNKVPVNPPNLINDLIDEVTQTVKITVPAPIGIVLNKNQFISGAFGFDGIGKDKVYPGKVCGYFKLIGPT